MFLIIVFIHGYVFMCVLCFFVCLCVCRYSLSLLLIVFFLGAGCADETNIMWQINVLIWKMCIFGQKINDFLKF